MTSRTAAYCSLAAAFIVLAILTAGRAESIPYDAVEAHKYADGVLFPRFHAALNDWHYQHPQDRAGKPWEHCGRLDAGDVKRWQLLRESFQALDAAMKRAG